MTEEAAQNSNNNQKQRLVHWADTTANRIIKQKGDKQLYTLASGITPSGVVHFGNFREVITVDFVARALRSLGKDVRFIFSWDDYDTFRKVPKNLPKQDELTKYLYRPIVDTPDPHEEAPSYAQYHEQKFESQLEKVGVEVEPIYQSKKYRAGDYSSEIIKALDAKEDIAQILNQYRSTPLDQDKWWPVSVYCEKCQTDHKTNITSRESSDKISYQCDNCGHSSVLSIKETSHLKLPWRIDWPMRWAYEKVDFEPGGKDHSSQGGSFSTAKDIVKIYDWEAPVYLQYDFVSIKGMGGKMSSSSGNLVTVNDVLEIYTPEMVRWIFASYKSNVDFAVSFDLDVIKTFEDFDRQERVAYGVDQANDKKRLLAQRVMELSSVDQTQELTFTPEHLPFRPSFRHLTNILQIFSGDIAKALEVYKAQSPESFSGAKAKLNEEKFVQRAQCALNWLEKFAPEDFKFSLSERKIQAEELGLNDNQTNFVQKLSIVLKNEWEEYKTDSELNDKIYEVMHSCELKPLEAFPPLYKMLIGKEKGPKLAGFIRTIGKEKVNELI